MLSGSITVPAYTTYAERDYEYIINDCTPTVIFVSNLEQFNKVKNIIKNKDFIKKVFSFDNLENVNENEYQNINNLFSDFNNENLKIEIKDYYFSNVVAKSSKTMIECNNAKMNLKSTGTEG